MEFLFFGNLREYKKEMIRFCTSDDIPVKRNCATARILLDLLIFVGQTTNKETNKREKRATIQLYKKLEFEEEIMIKHLWID